VKLWASPGGSGDRRVDVKVLKTSTSRKRTTRRRDGSTRSAALTFVGNFDMFFTTHLLFHQLLSRTYWMAQHKSAEKRARKARRQAARNREWKSRMRSAIKRVRTSKNRETALTELRKTVKLLDQLASKGVIHSNKAANNKSSLTRFVNSLK
jgi:small subunit ribosomal protein S20